MAVSPYQVTASGQKRSRGSDPSSASLPYPINLAPLTTLPDRVLGTFYAWPVNMEQPVIEAIKAAAAWRKSKETVGLKSRKQKQGGWAKVDKYENDGAGLLITRPGANSGDGDLDGMLG
jgi:hypothetical protein